MARRKSGGLILAAILTIALGVTTLAQAAGDGPISYWAGEGNALDTVGTNNGTLHGGTRFEAGVLGDAFRFEHIGDAVLVPAHPSLNLETMPAASIQGWMQALGNPSSSGDMNLVAKHECGYANGWFFTTRSGSYIAGNYVGGFGTGNVNLEDGKLHHFAIVKDGNTLSEYVDGELTGATTNASFAAPVLGTNIYIGSMLGGGSPFDPCFAAKHQLNGLIDEVQIYHRALTAGEIRITFHAGNRGAGAGNRSSGAGNEACDASKGKAKEHGDDHTNAINCPEPTPPDGGGGGGV